MRVHMARAVIREKENFRAFQLILFTFIALKSWTCQLVTNVENLLKIKTPLNRAMRKSRWRNAGEGAVSLAVCPGQSHRLRNNHEI